MAEAEAEFSGPPVDVKVTAAKGAGVYVRACRSFLHGSTGKDGETREGKPEITVGALGSAIATLAACTGRCESEGFAQIVRVETGYPTIKGRTERQVAQMTVTLKGIEEKEPWTAPDESGYHEKKLKVVKKEGGKKGAEIAGAADMGGMEYFTTTCETPEGDEKLLQIVCQEMNAKIDPAAEETKGGSGAVAKMLLSANDKQLALVAYVPKAKAKTISAKQWMQAILDNFGTGAFVDPAATDCQAVAVAKADGDKGYFPIKLRDQGIAASIQFLKAKGVFPDDDDDDDDEMVFGDDDFPCG